MHTKAVVDVSRDAVGRVLLTAFLGEIGRGLVGTYCL